MDISQTLAVTLKFISPFNWISRRRVKHREGTSRAVGSLAPIQAAAKVWDRVAVAGGCLLHPKTHPHTFTLWAPWLRWLGEQQMPYFWCQISASA